MCFENHKTNEMMICDNMEIHNFLKTLLYPQPTFEKSFPNPD